MKVVQINSVCGIGSTGGITIQLSRTMTENNIENYILYTYNRYDYHLGIRYSNTHKIKYNALLSRVFGNYGFNSKSATRKLIEHLNEIKPDIVIAGPAFNAGRFGIACCEVCKFVQSNYGIPSVTGLYWENPGVEMYKADCYIMEVGKSAATIRKAIPLITGFVNKLIAGEKLGTPKQEHYYPKGQRVNVFHEKNGAQRAVDMLVKKVTGQPYGIELDV